MVEREGDLFFLKIRYLQFSERQHFGHVNHKNVLRMKNNRVVNEIKFKQRQKPNIGLMCIKVFMTRTPFSTRTLNASGILNIIHSDTCGPM